MSESPLFSKTYDFVAWLIPLTIKFPRQQRFVLAATLQREALRFQELLIEAAHLRQPHATLVAADALPHQKSNLDVLVASPIM